MGTAIGLKHPVPDRVKPSFVIFDIRALLRWQQWTSKGCDLEKHSGKGRYLMSLTLYG